MADQALKFEYQHTLGHLRRISLSVSSASLFFILPYQDPACMYHELACLAATTVMGLNDNLFLLRHCIHSYQIFTPSVQI